MGQSIFLLIDELAPNQTNAFQTVNDAVAALEAASNEPLIVDSSANGDVIVPILDFVRYGALRIAGHTAEIDLVVPDEIDDDPLLISQRIINIYNEEVYPINVRTVADAGYTVVAPYSSKLVLVDGDDVVPLATNPPHTVGLYSFGTPGASDVMLRYNFVESVTYANEFLGSIGEIATNPTGSFVMTVEKNGVGVGSITISTGGAYTFATTGAEVQFDYGDVLTVTAPVAPDATAAGISATLLGKRT
jgi:hypothetical protein